MKLSEDPSIPVLPGWVNLTEVAEILGVSRQHAHRRAAAGKYKSLHRIGTQPVFVVSVKELEQLKKAKSERDAARKEAAEKSDENSSD